MERYAGSRWPKGFGLVLAALALVSLVTFHPFDPTVTNLLSSREGVHNALGLPGALVGGSLVEGVGSAALLIPLLIANWFLLPRRRPRAASYLLHGALLLLFVSAYHGLLVADPRPALAHPGLLGWAGGRWAEATTGSLAGGVILLGGISFALTRVAYAVPWSARGREAGAVARHLAGQAATLAGELAAAGREAVLALGDLALQGAGGIAFALQRSGGALGRMTDRLNPLAYRPRLAPHRPPAPPAEWYAVPRPVPLAEEPPPAPLADGLDAWLEAAAPAEPSEGPGARPPSPDAPSPVERGGRPAAPPEPEAEATPATERIAFWEERLRRYRENLDLDWGERLLGQPRPAALEPEADREEEASEPD